MPLKTIPSIRFEIYLPVSYSASDPSQENNIHYVNLGEVVEYLAKMMKDYKGYEGYTLSNPQGLPPLAGGYQGEELERNYYIVLVFPDHLMGRAVNDVTKMVEYFQTLFNQREIFLLHTAVMRYQPQESYETQTPTGTASSF
jgi:hypothetical protein